MTQKVNGKDNMALGEYRSYTGPGLGGPSQGYQSNASGYLAVPSSDGGVNYFRKVDTGVATVLQPITREQYAQGTGEDVGSIEQRIAGSAQDQMDQAEINNANGLNGNGTPMRTTDRTGTNDSRSVTTPAFTPVTFMQQTYTDPESLAMAKRAYIDKINREKLGEMNAGLRRYIGGENNTWENVGGEIGERKTSFLKQIADALDNYTKSEAQDYGKIRGYYAGLGDVSQSSEGIRNADVAQEYAKDRADLDTQKTQGLTGLQRTFQDYLDSVNSQKTNLARNYMTTLDELANSTQGDIDNVMANGTGGQQLQITSPAVQAATGGKSTSLLGSLRRVKDNVFRINRGNNGDNSEQNILSYLYQ